MKRQWLGGRSLIAGLTLVNRLRAMISLSRYWHLSTVYEQWSVSPGKCVKRENKGIYKDIYIF